MSNDCDAVCIDIGMLAELDDGDLCDNCPMDSNSNRADKDGDGIGNICDDDFVPSGC